MIRFDRKNQLLLKTHFKSNQINKSCGYIYPLSAKTTDWKITK